MELNLLISNVYNPVIPFVEKIVRQRLIILFVVILVVLSACGGGEASGTSTPVPTDTPVVPPTLTPTAATPLAILMLITANTVDEIVEANQEGADECLVKPVNPAELLEKINALS